MKDISWKEYADCSDYAERVIDFYKLCNAGATPDSPAEAALAVREYNRERKPFRALYGYSIRGYVDCIVGTIGLILEGLY